MYSQSLRKLGKFYNYDAEDSYIHRVSLVINTEEIAPESYFASETKNCNLSREERTVFLGSYVKLKGTF